MAHLELAYLLASPRSKGSPPVVAGSVAEAGQETVTESPSFGQWLRTSILGHPTTGETDPDLKETLFVPEESLDSSDEEAVNVQTLQDPQQRIDSTNSDDFSTDNLQIAAANLQSDDSETGSETEVSTSGLEQQAPIQTYDETEIISTPRLETEKLSVDESQLKKPITRIANKGVTVHSPCPFAGEGLVSRSPCQEVEGIECLHDREEERPQTTDKEPLTEMPWAGFSLFMESRAALQDVVSSRKDPTLTANKISGFGENESMRAVPESMVLSENRAVSPRRMEVNEPNISPSAGLVIDSRLEESRELLSSLKLGETARATASGDRGILEKKVFIGPQISAKINQPELAPVNLLTPQKGNKLASAVITPLVNNLRDESKASGLSEQLPNDVDLERSEQKPLSQLPVTPVGRIVSPETVLSVRPAIPSSIPIIPATPEAAATSSVIPTPLAASTTPAAFLTVTASSDSAALVIPSPAPASVAVPVISATPSASAAPAAVLVTSATPATPTLPAAPLSPTAPNVNPVAMATPISPPGDAVPVASPARPNVSVTPVPALATAPVSAAPATVLVTPTTPATPTLPAAPLSPTAPGVNPVAMATPISPSADAVPVASPARPNVSVTPVPTLATAPASAGPATVPVTPATPATPTLPAAPLSPTAPGVNPVAMATPTNPPADAVPVASAAVPNAPATPAPTLATALTSVAPAAVPAAPTTPTLRAAPTFPVSPAADAVAVVNPVRLGASVTPASTASFVSAAPATIPAMLAIPTVSVAPATVPITSATPLMSPPQTDSGTLAVISNAPPAPPPAPNASLSATPATPTASSTLIASMATAVVIENDRINITAPDRTAVIQQTLPLGGLRPQRRSRFAEPFADGAPKSTEKQSATDRLMAGTTIMGDSLRTTRTANHLTSDPAFDNAGWKTPSVNRNLPSHEATDQIDQQSNDAAVSSRVLDRKEISAKAANVQSVEPNVPVVGVTSTTVSNASPVAAIRTETPSSTGPSTLPETLDLRQSNWGRALGHQLNWMVNHRMQEAEIRVNPPQLGPLEVRMSLHQNQTSVTFFCHDAAVREAIESAIPRLREMLDSQGIFLNQAQVSDQSLARQQAGSGEQSSHNPRDGRPSASHQPDPELPSQETKSRPRPNLPGTVDDYA